MSCAALKHFGKIAVRKPITLQKEGYEARSSTALSLVRAFVAGGSNGFGLQITSSTNSTSLALERTQSLCKLSEKHVVLSQLHLSLYLCV